MSNQNYSRAAEKYNLLVRGAVIVGTLVAMYISATFSKDGFAFEMGSEYEWMGWALAGLAIIIQLAWNRMEGDKGLTIYVIGVSIYLYSIYTNFIGIQNAQVGDGWAFPLLFSLILDILPEPFFVWAVAGITSDPLGKAVSGMNKIIDDSRTLPQTQSQRDTYRNQRNRAQSNETSSRAQGGNNTAGRMQNIMASQKSQRKSPKNKYQY